MSGMEFKDVGVSGVKVIGDPKDGIVEAWVSTTNVIDQGKDNIQPGAYKSTLERRTPKGVWSHDMNTPVSKTIEIEELAPGDKRLPAQVKALGAGALRVMTQFNLNTTAGKDAYENVTFFGDSQEWSIGYAVPNGGATFEKGIRLIHELELYEYSPVLFGMAPGTSSAAVKALTAAHAAKAMVAVDGSWEDTREDIWEALVPWVASQFPGTETSVCIDATFPDRIVATIQYYGVSDGAQVQWEVPYTLDDATDEVSFGAPREVEIIGVITPDDDSVPDPLPEDDGGKAYRWERKEGRVLSAASLSNLQDVHDTMGAAHKKLAAVIAAHGAKPAEKAADVVTPIPHISSGIFQTSTYSTGTNTGPVISPNSTGIVVTTSQKDAEVSPEVDEEPEVIEFDPRDLLEHERLSSLQ